MNVLFFLMLTIIFFLLLIIGIFIYFGRRVVFLDAIELYKKGQVDEALEKLKVYVKTQKNDVKAKELLAKIYMEKDEVQNCLKENIGITLSSAATPIERSNAYAKMTKIYFDERDFTKAINAAGRGLKYNKENTEIYYYLGRIYLLSGKERRAGKMLNEVLKYDRGHIPTRMELVDLHMAEKNYIKARFQLKKILELDNQNDEARYKLAELYYSEEELEESAKEMEYIKNIEGKENLYYRVLSEYYLKIGNLDRAQEVIEKMLNEKIEYFLDLKIYLQYKLANIYELKERYEDALNLYKEVKDKNARYNDVEDRVKSLMKYLQPDEFKHILDEINYMNINYEGFIKVAKTMIEKMGMMLNYQLEDTGKMYTGVISDKYNMSHNKPKFFYMLLKQEEVGPRDLQKFLDKMSDNKLDHGIIVTLGEYSESALEFAGNFENLEILDKVHVHDIVGESILKEHITAEGQGE